MEDTGTSGRSLDGPQKTVVCQPVGARQIVCAAPGCGKTHVACARVAKLLDDGQPPDAILVLSFTRVAVHEMRSRIANASTAVASKARGVEIKTLDALAWRLSVATGDAAPTSHDASIDRALEVLHQAQLGLEPDVRGYLDRFTHVVVDEAQDLVGTRALLVLKLLNLLRDDAGWTVFHDPAQAIYGWAGEATDGQVVELFGNKLGDLRGTTAVRDLNRVYRTSDPALLDLLSQSRRLVLGAAAGKRLAALQSYVESRITSEQPVGAAEIPSLTRALGKDASACLILMRRRVDVLAAASYMRNEELPCRLRIGGLPRLAAPWIAVTANQLVLSECRTSHIQRADFERVWASRCHGRWLATGWSSDTAWNFLRQTGPSGREGVDLRAVATRIAMRVAPDEAFTREIGTGGPVIGTVHGSKGREASHVIFCLPGLPDSDDLQSDEEARVIYVALSRAMKRLDIHRGRPLRCGYHGERAWRATRTGIQVEIGRDEDIDAVSPMCMQDGTSAERMQEHLGAFDGRPVSVAVACDRESWTWKVTCNEQTMGWLSKGCVDDLDRLVKSRNRAARKPTFIPHLTWMDTTTTAVTENHPRAHHLHSPWRESRLWLAPVVLGLGYIKRFQ